MARARLLDDELSAEFRSTDFAGEHLHLVPEDDDLKSASSPSA
jgi:hypothetical protein